MPDRDTPTVESNAVSQVLADILTAAGLLVLVLQLVASPPEPEYGTLGLGLAVAGVSLRLRR